MSTSGHAEARQETRLSRAFSRVAHHASAAGISERHLSRVFAEAGTSVPRHILGHRLDVAHALLSREDPPRTADVAAWCGFSSAGYFSQTFRRRFEMTAGEIRRGRG